ncbi:cell wall-binding repeat-containing protein [Bacillus sp. KH172YL63]|uniref:cell wall-binding repeat-containing protein n=1 Tax=Bacillus sp. KH172YL63 TaxID=2709784 RepID=UPI0013E45F59|nr:cell wall-binding repeat-containing protein [Bacillus sp. KH172YL63]BCB05771.1 hypothetical protein KH172YL63_39040 [Bacillus sp. KH172YL63]
MRKLLVFTALSLLFVGFMFEPFPTLANEGMDSNDLKSDIAKIIKGDDLNDITVPKFDKLNEALHKNESQDHISLLGEIYENEPNDDFPQANNIRKDDIIIGQFNWSQDVDVYKIQINKTEDLYVLGSTEYTFNDLGYLLFDSRQEPVYPDEWVSDETDDIQAYYALPAGTYYIATTDLYEYGGDGRYALMAVSDDSGEENYENVLRIAGNNRYETAVEVSKVGWPEGADTVVLARDSNFPDALAGAPLAYKHDAPILLNPKDSLQSAVKNQLKYLEAKNVIILGGTSAITSKVERELKQMGLNIKRIGGKSRYDTAAKIAAEIGDYDKAVIAYGENFPDALSIAPYAAANQIPILLSPKDQLPAETSTALKKVSHTIIVGGTNVISDKVKKGLASKNPVRIAGKDRYDTSVKVAERLPMSSEMITVATGENFADALTGSVLAAKFYEPIILVKKNNVPSPVTKYIQENGTWYFTVLGGEAAISQEAVGQLVSN